jgi:uncharacterized damage-inducible protein DinB
MEHALSFLVDTYETERLKTLGVWAQFGDDELGFRPAPRARTAHEHMVHQCAGEDFWMRTMLAVDLGRPPLPVPETRQGFIEIYAAASAARLAMLRSRSAAWFDETTRFFDAERTRAWVLMRRIAHTAHHRGQLTLVLRLLGKELHSTYGPTADTGGLFQDGARVIYAHDSVEELLESVRGSRAARSLPGPGEKPPTERP